MALSNKYKQSKSCSIHIEISKTNKNYTYTLRYIYTILLSLLLTEWTLLTWLNSLIMLRKSIIKLIASLWLRRLSRKSITIWATSPTWTIQAITISMPNRKSIDIIRTSNKIKSRIKIFSVCFFHLLKASPFFSTYSQTKKRTFQRPKNWLSLI